MIEYSNLSPEYVIEYIKNIANEDDVVVNLSSHDAVYNYLRFKYLKNSKNLQKDLVDFVKTKCNKFLYISTFNQIDYFKHIIEKRGYAKQVSYTKNGVEVTENVINKQNLSNEILNLSDNEQSLKEYEKFKKFFKKLKDYVVKNDDVKLKYGTLENFIDKELGYKYVAIKKYDKEIEGYKEVIKKFADKSGCLDALRATGNYYNSITKSLRKNYKPDNLVEELPILEQFVANELGDYYFSNMFVKMNVVENLFEQLNKIYPDKYVIDFSKKHRSLYYKFCHARNMIAPFVTMKEFIEHGNDNYQFIYPYANKKYAGKIYSNKHLRKILTAGKQDDLNTRIKNHYYTVLLKARAENMTVNDYLNDKLHINYNGKSNYNIKPLTRAKVVNSVIENGKTK